jgi:hypothetical protein
MAGFAAVSLATQSRFFMLLAVAVVFVISLRRRQSEPPSGRSVALGAIVGVVATMTLYLSYPALATSGVLGERAQTDQMRISASGANFLVSNRAEMFQAAYITAHNPVLGIGGKGRLSSLEAEETLAWLHDLGVEDSPAKRAYLLDAYATGQGYAPHSSMLVSSIQAGVGALPFWLLSLGLVFYRGFQIGDRRPPQAALYWFLAGQSAWNAFFSPLSTTTCLSLMLALFLAIAGRPTQQQEGRQSNQTVSGISPVPAAHRPQAVRK